MCAQCIRHPINGSVFHSLSVCFFWLLSGWCWNNDRKPASFWWNLKFMNDYTTSQRRKRQLCIFLSCQCEQSDFFHSNDHSHYISSTCPFRSAAVWFTAFWDLRRWAVSVHLPQTQVMVSFNPLNKHWFVSFHMWHTQLKYTQPFHFNVWFAELWLHLKVMPQVRSHFVRCAVCLRLVSLTASVWDWCFRR